MDARVKTAVATYRECIQAVRRWRAWIYRHAWRSAFLMLLVFSLTEPLGCLAHCQLWLSFSGTPVASAHQTHSHNLRGGFAEDQTMVFVDDLVVERDHSVSDAALLPATLGTPSNLHGAVTSAQETCVLNGIPAFPWQPTNESTSAPPHEHLAALIIFMCVTLVLLVHHVSRGASSAAPLPAYRPPLRPPITLPA